MGCILSKGKQCWSLDYEIISKKAMSYHTTMSGGNLLSCSKKKKKEKRKNTTVIEFWS